MWKYRNFLSLLKGRLVFKFSKVFLMVWDLFSFAVSGFFCSESLYLLFSDLIFFCINKTSITDFFSLMDPVCHINMKVWYSQNCFLWILYILLLVLLTGSLSTVALQDLFPKRSPSIICEIWPFLTCLWQIGGLWNGSPVIPWGAVTFVSFAHFSGPIQHFPMSYSENLAWGWRSDPVISLHP